jgi:lipoprotein-releasing system permease protein
VYVPFDVLQRDLQMDERKADDGSVLSPARCSEINIKLQPGTDLAKARDEIQSVCAAVYKDKSGMDVAPFVVQTWEDANRTWLHAIENEKVLVTFLFSLISLVAVFLILCIFYMIVVEKTRDIGIIKSVGATHAGVAGIFLGYGLTIGLVGSGLGFVFGWLIVHYINELHTWLGKAMGIVIWDPQVYLFDKIPNTMNSVEVTIILAVAVLSAVLGSLIPSLVAANLKPVESLRWE